MAKTPRKQYPNDFRIKVAKEAQEGSPTEVAKKYKLPENSVYNWRAVLRTKGEAGFVGMGKRGPGTTKKGLGAGFKLASSAAIKKRLEKATGQALNGVLDELRGQITKEQKLRIAVEKELQGLRNKLQQLSRR